MIYREKLLDETYFDKRINFIKKVNKENMQEVTTNPDKYPKIQILYYSLFRYQYQLLISKFSRGYPINGLKNDFVEIVKFWEQYLNHPAHAEFIFKESLEDYELALWLFSIGILLRTEESIMIRLLKCINNESEDELFQQLVLRYNKKVFTAQDSTKLVYPKIFKSIFDSTIVSDQDAIKHLQVFLQNWYKNMKPCYWHDNHKGKDGGGFFGYWCWEAALVTYLYDLDDATYRNMPYYPKDMVDFARGDNVSI